MSEQQQENVLGIFTVFILVGITLKMMGYIDWSWWLILAPVWISMSIGIVMAIIIIIIDAWERHCK